MEEFLLSDDVIEQIKDFDYRELTDDQSLLIDKLILNKELKKCYKWHGLCNECKQLKITNDWCQCKFQQNFKNWTSGNNEVDQFIQKTQLKAKWEGEILEWIEYDRFENVKYLSKGGFGTIYKATWKDGNITEWDSENNQWRRINVNSSVVLKCLHNSQNITAEFLRVIELHMKTGSSYVIRCYGITKDPESNNFMMVMDYADNGSLRQRLNNCFDSMGWYEKLDILHTTAKGLDVIHYMGFIHHDFHCGNILSVERNFTRITDLGLCRPANVVPSQDENKKIYGVLPYVAPEVLRGKEYTQESDIYSFGIIAYEVCTGLPPYHDIAHDKILAISICQGLRPKSNYEIPQLILNIIKQCWDANPLKRPKAKELYNLLHDLFSSILLRSDDEFNKQIKEADKFNGRFLSDDEFNKQIKETDKFNRSDDEFNKQIKEADKFNERYERWTFSSLLYPGYTLSYTINPQAVYTSRLLDFKNLPEPKNAIDNKDDDKNAFEYSESIEAKDFTT